MHHGRDLATAIASFHVWATGVLGTFMTSPCRTHMCLLLALPCTFWLVESPDASSLHPQHYNCIDENQNTAYSRRSHTCTERCTQKGGVLALLAGAPANCGWCLMLCRQGPRARGWQEKNGQLKTRMPMILEFA
jgi:hypothetical protein